MLVVDTSASIDSAGNGGLMCVVFKDTKVSKRRRSQRKSSGRREDRARAATAALESGQNITPEISKVKFHWKMPLKIHWTIPVKIHWKSDNPLENTTDK